MAELPAPGFWSRRYIRDAPSALEALRGFCEDAWLGEGLADHGPVVDAR